MTVAKGFRAIRRCASNARDVPARRAKPAGFDGAAIGKIYRRADVSMQAACPRAITRAGTARKLLWGGEKETYAARPVPQYARTLPAGSPPAPVARRRPVVRRCVLGGAGVGRV